MVLKYFYFPFSRSNDFNPDNEELGGKRFILFAVMTDVAEDVILGTDGVEHL